MIYIMTGTAAFFFLFLFDVFTLKNNGISKHICGGIGLATLIFSGIMSAVVSDRYAIPAVVKYPSWLLWIIAAGLLIYSLFLELPFENTYKKQEHSTVLINTGTYALCRHPGVLWFALLFFFFFLATGARLILIAGIIWTGMDILHVYLQEKLFFPKMFPAYTAYMDNTPMLIPASSSLMKCISTIMRRRNDNDKSGRHAETRRV